ncbi:MAG: cyclohydrolase [Lachnospiraceae bacterium]|jgi:GTP cyclohydrolase I|nr:cyclohydrolase [Lachnospiraceae bacterium]
MDRNKIEEAVKLLLEGIGEDVKREGLQDTPKRIAKMCEELFGGLEKDGKEHLQKTFAASNNEMILEKDITFYSVCEHHLLPFYGKAHVAYIPDNQVVGLSKLARTVEVYSKRPQIQEQMTAQIADDIMKYLNPKGVMVMLEAEHMCMTMRGVKKPGTITTTYVVRGEFEDNAELRNTFFNLVRR